MKVKIRDAVVAVDARKRAAGLGSAAAGETAPLADVDLILVGLDLDNDELRDMATLCADQALEHIIAGRPPAAIAGGLWADGLMTGLMLAEMRARAEARAA